MDTFSHIVIGFGIGALAQLDPVVSSSHGLTQAVLFGAVIGSNAPDFDYMYRLKGKGSYFRNHRGPSHSLLILPLWGLLISGILSVFFPSADFRHLALWTFIAVILHVLFDLLNVHGTQILQPFSQKWVALGVIPLIDPYILTIHFLGFCLLIFYPAGTTFFIIYLFIFIYLAYRTLSTTFTKRYLETYFVNAEQIKLIPGLDLFKWNIIIETNEDFLFGTYSNHELFIDHTLPKEINFKDVVIESTKDQTISDFLAGTMYAFPIVKKRRTGYFVYWRDIRFRKKKFFFSHAIHFVSTDQKIKNSYIGRIHSLKKLREVLRKLQSPLD
ncbi:metal-dependent hydrolase [Neobacillus jeddahensis]|uniref:metal-dependent hydrolase n=1 Tax=Neobacillus jeddahensis TaxID=1461580 RepID=UPI00058F4041|nr:metal-dependent hydrolase [Neobacillus jeddahensis]